MTRRNFLLTSTAALLAGLATAQKPGDTPDDHPQLVTERCTVKDGCSEWLNFIVLDSSAHYVHQVDSELGCGDWGSKPNATACPTKEACAENCIMEGNTDYSKNGITTDGRNCKFVALNS